MSTNESARTAWYPEPYNEQLQHVLLCSMSEQDRAGPSRMRHIWLRKKAARRYRIAFALFLVMLVVFITFGSAHAQLAAPGAATQFDLTGFLQEATVSGTSATSGGTLKVNGHTVLVPDQTIVILPANALTWQELFAQAPAAYKALGQTGMALSDSPAPLSTYEINVVGNRVGDTYIAGLISVSQQSLNNGGGFINYIDYATGEIYVGGTVTLGATGLPVNTLDKTKPGVRISINDPLGRYGRAGSPDGRFTVDADNPTIRSATGFPMCLPRTNPDDPTAIPDALCPQGNRPKDATGNFVPTFTTPDPATIAAGQLPDPRIMAPFEVGDFISYAGTLLRDAGTSGPYPSGGAGTYISAHTITNNIAIYTTPGTNPAYVAVEVALIGTGGLTVLGANEVTIRTRFEGMTTDASRNIHLYGIDLDPITGATRDRDWGTVAVDPGAPVGAQQGRWRFRPPCVSAVATIKDCTPAAGGTFLPPTREMRAVIEGAWTPAMDQNATGGANKLIAGQYHAPIGEYLFPENRPGTVPVPNNFESMEFLSRGGYSSSTGVVVGQLKPWPGAQAPGSCTPPVASAGTDFTVAATAKGVPLSGSASGTGPITYAWSAEPSLTKLFNAGSANASFDVPQTTPPTSSILFTLTAAGCNGLMSTATVNATVLGSATETPVVQPLAPLTIASGTPVKLVAAGNLSNLTYAWSQTAGPAQTFVQTPAGTGAQIAFTPTIPLGNIASVVRTFTVVATTPPPSPQTVPPTALVSSAPVSVTVTVNPLPDSDTITSAVYRTSKFRLDLTATSTITSPGLVLTLQPYKTVTGTTFDPATVSGAILTNGGGGNYTLGLVGVPQPAAGASLTIKSSIGGTSPATPLSLLRT